jgi:hypothetical protein
MTQKNSYAQPDWTPFTSIMIFVMLSLTTPNVWAKPFGLEMGMSLEETRCLPTNAG